MAAWAENGRVELRKGRIRIAVETWLRRQHPHSAITAADYVERYRRELEADGWEIVEVGA